MKRSILILSLVLSLSPALLAQSIWKADKAHSEVKFTVTHLVISEVSGRFNDFDITLTQGSDDFSGSTIEGSLKTASINTDNDFRDKHLKSDDFFNAEQFPTISFKSTSFEKTGTDTYKIAGNLTIRDVTKPVVFDAKLLGTMTDAKGNTKAGFKATTTIDRFAFGVKWDRKMDAGGFIVSKEVAITINAELAKQAAKTTESK